MNAEYIKQVNQVVNALDDLKENMHIISHHWNNNGDIENVMCKEKEIYPFDRSFDDVTEAVNDWCLRLMAQFKTEVLVHSIYEAMSDATDALTTMSNSCYVSYVDNYDIKEALNVILKEIEEEI